MRSLTAFFVLLVSFMAPVSLAHAQNAGSANKGDGSTSGVATKEEVNQLRSEVAAQRQTIEELKALVEKLAEGKTAAAISAPAEIRPVAETSSASNNAQPVDAPSASAPRLMNAVLLAAEPEPAAVVDQTPAAAPKKDAPLTAGWNGEHFFIRSADGQFTISPYGYVNTDYRAYSGDGVPANTFLLRQARFGFQGSYGSHFDFALLTDASATTGSVVRDVYLNVRLRPELQFQAGQFKAPFAQETGIGDTSLDFAERGFQSMLYPSAATAYRSPAPRCTATFQAALFSTGSEHLTARDMHWPTPPMSRRLLGAFASTRGADPRTTGSSSSPLADPLIMPVRAVFPGIKASAARCPTPLTLSSRSSPLTDPFSGTTVSLLTSNRRSRCAVNSINSTCPATTSAPNKQVGWAS